MRVGEGLKSLLNLAAAPVSLSFVDERPAGVPRVSESAISGCSYWKRSSAGEVFYTEAADHYQCPIGAYTHGVELPPAELEQQQIMITMMEDLGYLKAQDVPGIPRVERPFRFLVSAPVSKAPCPADVVLVHGTPKQMMLLSEAAMACGLESGASMGRPTCAAIPAVMAEGTFVSNLGCVGSRVYTELPDHELYVVFPGSRLEDIESALSTIIGANRQLAAFHSARI